MTQSCHPETETAFCNCETGAVLLWFLWLLLRSCCRGCSSSVRPETGAVSELLRGVWLRSVAGFVYWVGDWVEASVVRCVAGRLSGGILWGVVSQPDCQSAYLSACHLPCHLPCHLASHATDHPAIHPASHPASYPASHPA